MQALSFSPVLLCLALCVAVTLAFVTPSRDKLGLEALSAPPALLSEATLLGVCHQRDKENLTAQNLGSWASYKQCDSRWAGNQLGTCSQTVCQAGCAMSSVAMVLTTKGCAQTPQTLNAWLKSHGGYASGCLIYWGSVDKLGCTKFMGIQYPTYSQICTGVSQGHGVVINVRGGSHWVLVTGCDGNGNYYVNDPGFACTSYSSYNVLAAAVYH